MPLEIRELVVRTTITDDSQQRTLVQPQVSREFDREELIAEVVRKVVEQLQERNER